MQVLVMGGSLFNGRSLVKVLVESGHDVTVCNRGRTPVTYPDGVAHIAADRTDADQLRSALGGHSWDAVVDMSSYHPGDAELAIDVFSGSTGHYIFISSTVTYATGSPSPMAEDAPDDRGPNQNEYGLHKLLAEDVLFAAHQADGFPATTVSLSMVMGPHNALPGREQRMFARMLTGRPVLIPGDGSTLGVVGHVDDQSRAIESILGAEASFGRRFNLTGDDAHSDTRYVDVLESVTGATADRVAIPAPIMDQLWDGDIKLPFDTGARPTMDIRSTEDSVARIMPHIHKFQLATIIQRLQPNVHRWDHDVVFSVDAIKAIGGWTPSFDFPGCVADTYEWWQSAGGLDRMEYDFAWEDEILTHLR